MVKKASTLSSSENSQSDVSKNASSESNQKISNDNGLKKDEPVHLDVKPESKSVESEVLNESSVTVSVEETLEQGMIPRIIILS